MTKATQEHQQRERDVTLPVSGLTVRIRGLSAEEVAEIIAKSYNGDPYRPDMGLHLIQRSLIEPQTEKSHVDMLAGLSSTDIAFLNRECADLSDLDRGA